MALAELRDKIERKEARLAVIGLGYVGLPVACAFADAGFDVVGIELRPDRVKQINEGISPIEGNEPGLAELLARVVAAKKPCATTEYQGLADRDVVLIDVDTASQKSLDKACRSCSRRYLCHAERRQEPGGPQARYLSVPKMRIA